MRANSPLFAQPALTIHPVARFLISARRTSPLFTQPAIPPIPSSVSLFFPDTSLKVGDRVDAPDHERVGGDIETQVVYENEFELDDKTLKRRDSRTSIVSMTHYEVDDDNKITRESTKVSECELGSDI